MKYSIAKGLYELLGFERMNFEKFCWYLYKNGVITLKECTKYIRMEEVTINQVKSNAHERTGHPTQKPFDDMKTIDKYEAFKMLAKSHIEDGGELGAEEAFNQLENLEQNGEVLLIDRGLI
ncbi:ASCH domain protein [Enterococcus faecalis]|uniref:ASCH domain protein n=1 Tax=Enterococcus faecalis TaxID=1351 RepID=UPI0025B164F3|nr:ASCH domain protein [Enterococcus faecalis]MDN3201690.1 ASCH domain protein [Enterococcus faecalis]